MEEITDWNKLQLEAAEAALKSKQALLDYVLQGEGYADLIAACDEALNWADANARAFPIETAPKERWIEAWDAQTEKWRPVYFRTEADMENPYRSYTHWREPFPPPSNPPLPEPLERLGEVLRRIKGVS